MLLTHDQGQKSISTVSCIAVQLLLGCTAFRAVALQTVKILMDLSLVDVVSRCGLRHDRKEKKKKRQLCWAGLYTEA